VFGVGFEFGFLSFYSPPSHSMQFRCLGSWKSWAVTYFVFSSPNLSSVLHFDASTYPVRVSRNMCFISYFLGLCVVMFHQPNSYLVVVCGDPCRGMGKTIRPSFFYEKVWKTFDSLPFLFGNKKWITKIEWKVLCFSRT